jgi:hypothetical protein
VSGACGGANGGKARRFFWKKSSSYSEWLNKGVKTMTNELEELQQMKRDLDEHIHLAETVSERQKLADLRDEVTADRAKVKELEAKAYQVAIANKSKIKTHLEEAERLRLESLDISMDSWELQSRLKAKRVEMHQLEQAIKQVE